MKYVKTLASIRFFYSDSIRSFLMHSLPAFCKENPGIEIEVSPRPNKHPVVIGHYINGNQKSVCMRNLEQLQILKKVELLRSNSGERNKRTIRRPVTSTNESVRGIWDPFHGAKYEI
jgi:large subunit ribosomal protein L43